MKFYVCNLGCKVNTYESNIMTESLIRNVAVYKRRFRTLVEDQLDEIEQFDDRL